MQSAARRNAERRSMQSAARRKESRFPGLLCVQRINRLDLLYGHTQWQGWQHLP